MVQVQMGYGGACGGSLIANNMVLSAAHCFFRNKSVDVFVVVVNIARQTYEIVHNTFSLFVPVHYCLYMYDVNATPDLRCLVTYIISFGFSVIKIYQLYLLHRRDHPS